MLIDTDVLICMTRGHMGAAARLQTILPWRISAVTYMELAQGCRNKQELERIRKGLASSQTEIVPVSAAISDRAMQLIDSYALSHGVQLGVPGRRVAWEDKLGETPSLPPISISVKQKGDMLNRLNSFG